MRAEVFTGLKWSFKHHRSGLLSTRVEEERREDISGIGPAGEEGLRTIENGQPQRRSKEVTLSLKDVSCFLRLRGKEANKDSDALAVEELVDVVSKGHHVFDIPHLLGQERMKELVEGTFFEEAELVAVKNDHRTKPAQIMLMKLEVYLRDFKS